MQWSAGIEGCGNWIREKPRGTYAMGAVPCSISPFTKVARSREVELISSWALLMVSLESNSSMTLSDFLFSDLTWEAVGASMTSAAGAMKVSVGVGRGGVEDEIRFLGGVCKFACGLSAA